MEFLTYTKELNKLAKNLQESTEIIEDIPSLYGINVKVKMPQGETVKSVHIVPDKAEIPFTQDGSDVSYRIPRHWCHTMVVIEY